MNGTTTAMQCTQKNAFGTDPGTGAQFSAQDRQMDRVCCEVDSTPVRSDNTAEAKRMAAELEQAKQQSKEFANIQEKEREHTKAVDAELKKVDQEADKKATELAKVQHNNQKQDAKTTEKLEKIEKKAISAAAELAEAREKEMEKERIRDEQLRDSEEKAHRLAVFKLQMIEQQRLAAEKRANELAEQQAEARRKFAELSQVKDEDEKRFKIQIDELHESELVARRQAELLQKQQVDDRKELGQIEKELEDKERNFKVTNDLLNQQQKELDELNRRRDELLCEEAATKDRAALIASQLEAERVACMQKQQEVAFTDQEAKDLDYLLKRQSEERKCMEAEFKKAGQSEEEARKRAKELADRHQEELQKAKKGIADLTIKERQAREQVHRTGQNVGRDTEQPTQMVDVYTHERVPAESPHLEIEPHVDAKGNEITADDEGKGALEKIGDAIKGIF